MPRRNAYIKGGEVVPVRVNYFHIKPLDETRDFQRLYQYECQIDGPLANSTRPLRDLFDAWREIYQDELKGALPCFDGQSTVWTGIPLPKALYKPGRTFELVVPAGPWEQPMTFFLSIKECPPLELSGLYEYLNGGTYDATSLWVYVSAYETVFRDWSLRHMVTFGRVTFGKRDKKSSDAPLEVRMGYFHSVRPGQGKLVLNMVATAFTFFKETGLVEGAARLLDIDLTRGASLPVLDSQSIFLLTHNFSGMRIKTTHSKGFARPYKIVRFTNQAVKDTMFSLEHKRLSVAAYFKQKYAITLQHPHLPCVVVGDIKNEAKQIFLPMEVCVLIGEQKASPNLSNHYRSMGKLDLEPETRALSPGTRADYIEDGIRGMGHLDNPLLKSFNIAVPPKLIECQGHRYQAPAVQYREKVPSPASAFSRGIWTMDGRQVLSGSTVQNWVMVSLVANHQLPIQKQQIFARRLKETMERIGVSIAVAEPVIMPPGDPESGIENILKHAYLAASEKSKLPVNLMIVVMPSSWQRIYFEIKRTCDTIIGIASQCVTSKVVKKADAQMLESMALKINVKLPGGLNSRVEKSYLSLLTEVPTMLLGYDVTHPTGGSHKFSVSALTASLDLEALHYSFEARIHPPMQEIGEDIGSMTVALLRRFYARMGRKPERLIIYRDGVGEGVFYNVISMEIPAIRKAFKALDADYNPKITILCVQKRHHLRMFAPKEHNLPTMSNGNLCPGYVIDTDVGQPSIFDFFLLSHGVEQGLAKPTRYTLLYDDSNFTPDQLAEFTFRSTFQWSRGTRSVMMPPPAYFAHVCAARARAHIVKCDDPDYPLQVDGYMLAPVKLELEKSMYFL
ncbi:hypothetical protein RI367_005619 [Sorochytrium milnesiophthora]